MNSIQDIDVKNKHVLIRVDFNVPLSGKMVVSNFRIKAAIPTIQYCLSQNCSVILMSHLGRPKGSVNPELSLEPVLPELESLLKKKVIFSENCVSDAAISTSQKLDSGEVHLLENLRFHIGETENDSEFSYCLSQHGQVFINDAFGTAHRAHASNVGILDYISPCAGGMLLENERKYLSNIIQAPEHPFVVVLGGSKVSGKIELISHLMSFADHFIIGGAMAYAFLKVKGVNVGGSPVDEENMRIAGKILNDARINHVEIHLPPDTVVSKDIFENPDWRLSYFDDISDMEMGVDIGPESAAHFNEILSRSKTILWNGPMGVFESPSFAKGTYAVASAISEMTKHGSVTIVGGGDTATAVQSFDLMSGFTHVSTGGGASLELLSGKYLPAFKALDDHE